MPEHFFGSDEITEVKLTLVERYLAAYTTALRKKFKTLLYIDAFAGTGTRAIKHEERPGDFLSEPEPERIELRRSSATIALEVQPAFDRLTFIESRAGYCRALEELRGRHAGRTINVVKGDANDVLQRFLHRIDWSDKRAVLFLDPYGMTVDFETLRAVAATKAIDVWYLASLEGLVRNAAKDPAKLDAHKEAALTRMTGTPDWRSELYRRAPVQTSLWGDDIGGEEYRPAGTKHVEQWFTERLRSVFPLVLDPYPLPQGKGPQRFSLYFALSSGDPKALAVGRRIADQILTSGK